MVGKIRKDWFIKFDDVLWVYRMVYKIFIRIIFFNFVYGKFCYLLVEIEYKVFWVIKLLNYDIKIVLERWLV